MNFRTHLVPATAMLLLLMFAIVEPDVIAENEADRSAQQFSNKSFALGVVVSDVEEAAKFYTQAIGFREVAGYDVPEGLGKEIGLTDGAAVGIRVFVLAEGDHVSMLKLMKIPGTKPRRPENRTIHSELGFSYLTVFVADMNAALARLEKTGVSPVSDGVVPLPKSFGFPQDMYIVTVRDPDGNLIELFGPKK